jgi:hypothetical protein
MRYSLVVALVFGMTFPAWGQARGPSQDGSFRVTWQSERDGSLPWIEGRVFNASPRRVTNVRVRIEGFDGAGRVVAKTVVWALGDIDPGAETSFRAQPMSGAVDYHVGVVSYDVVSGPEAP